MSLLSHPYKSSFKFCLDNYLLCFPACAWLLSICQLRVTVCPSFSSFVASPFHNHLHISLSVFSFSIVSSHLPLLSLFVVCRLCLSVLNFACHTNTHLHLSPSLCPSLSPPPRQVTQCKRTTFKEQGRKGLCIS